MVDNKIDVAIIGAGIVGLAHAYAAAKKGLKVVVFERNQKAIGASVRNFGLIWPIGQAPGKSFQRALRSREIYMGLSQKAGFWLKQNGALHLAYHREEMDVIEEFYANAAHFGYQCEVIAPQNNLISSFIKKEGLKGALYSTTELTVDPREVTGKLPEYLTNNYGVVFNYGTAISHISMPKIFSGRRAWHAEKVIICGGVDFETLYPEEFRVSALTKCKLQMMRVHAQKNPIKLGPTLCAGMTLLHYSAFRHCKSLDLLKIKAQQEYPQLLEWGIHVLLAQNGKGELIIGDSHEYGLNPEPFDKDFINESILNYLNTFVSFNTLPISERWHGIYSKIEGQTELVLHPEKDVTIVNGLGGAGMTLSFGLAEEIVDGLFHTSLSMPSV